MPRPFHRLALVASAAAIAFLSLNAVAQAGSVQEQRSSENVQALVDRADMTYRGRTTAAVLDMRVNATTYKRRYRLVYWDRRRGQGRSLVKILGPSLWRGFGTLKVGEQLKLYNPKRNQITIVSQSMLSDRWMGSHFTNDDLVKHTRLGKHYNARLIRKFPGATTLYKIELTPKRNAPVAWGKVIYQLSVTGGIVLPVRADYYRRRGSGRASRTITWRKVGRLGGRIIPREMKIVLSSKPGESTTIRFRKIRFNIGVPGRRFSENQLRR